MHSTIEQVRQAWGRAPRFLRGERHDIDPDARCVCGHTYRHHVELGCGNAACDPWCACTGFEEEN